MSDAAAERREQILGLLAEKGLALACDTQQAAINADEADEKARLAGAFVKLARMVRQTLSLHAKFEKARLSGDADLKAEAADARAERVARHKRRIARALTRQLDLAYDEDDSDPDDFNDHAEAVNERLADLAEDEDFLDQDPDALIAQLCQEFGLEPPEPFTAPASPTVAAVAEAVEPTGPTCSPGSLNGHDSS